MKDIVKLMIVVIAMTMTTGLVAQNFGVRAGLNLAKIQMDIEGENNDPIKIRPGFHLGVTAEFPMAQRVSFETGLLLSQKGFSISDVEYVDYDTYKAEGGTSLLYLDIPLTFKAWADLGGARLYGALGPYVGFGLSGRSKYELSYNEFSETQEEDINWGSGEEDQLKRLDYGLSMGAGIELGAFQIGVSYGLGLANILSLDQEDTSMKNRVFGVSLRYGFKI
jgi:hypothetical protein